MVREPKELQEPKQSDLAAACLGDNTLAAFIDGSAAPEARSLWEKHLSNCSECSAALAAVLMDLEVTADDLAHEDDERFRV